MEGAVKLPFVSVFPSFSVTTVVTFLLPELARAVRFSALTKLSRYTSVGLELFYHHVYIEVI